MFKSATLLDVARFRDSAGVIIKCIARVHILYNNDTDQVMEYELEGQPLASILALSSDPVSQKVAFQTWLQPHITATVEVQMSLPHMQGNYDLLSQDALTGLYGDNTITTL